jgi:hypothetical protein
MAWRASVHFFSKGFLMIHIVGVLNLRNFFNLSGLAIFLLVAGCATPYVEPRPSESHAKLRVMQTRAFGTTYVSELEEPCLSNFKSGRSIGSLQGNMTLMYEHRRKSLGIVDAPANSDSYTELRVPSDREFLLSVRVKANQSALGETSCQVGVSFIPKPGESYEAVYDYRPGERGCFMSVKSLHEQAGVISRNTIPVKPLPRCG